MSHYHTPRQNHNVTIIECFMKICCKVKYLKMTHTSKVYVNLKLKTE